MNYLVRGAVDIGLERNFLEDYIRTEDFEDSSILAIIADGSGTHDDRIQPAKFATDVFVDYFKKFRSEIYDYFKAYPTYYIEKCMNIANLALGTLHMANEELYSGYMTTMTVVYLDSEGHLYYSHIGNTRLYLLRNGQFTQMTTDHTLAQEKLDNNEEIEYYLSMDRLKLTRCLGLSTELNIESRYGTIKENDVLLLTSDGIHYAVREEEMLRLVLQSSVDDACPVLIEGAKSVNYPDNMAAIVIAQLK